MCADPWFWCECKVGRKVGYRAAMRQATADCAGTGLRPLVIAKDDRQEPVVQMYFSDYLWLMQLVVDAAGPFSVPANKED